MANKTKNHTSSSLADFGFWFSKDRWTLKEAATLVVGLNPDVVLKPEIRTMYDNSDIADNANYKIWNPLWRYSEERPDDWKDILDGSLRDIEGSYCASEMDDIIDDAITVKPMEFIQWCVDDTVRMHYRLAEYLKEIGFDFRFSKNSVMLSALQTFAKNDIWYLHHAARLVLGISPYATKERLRNQKNLYRHHTGDNLTLSDDVFTVISLALESHKTNNLEFFSDYRESPDDENYSEEDCPIEVEAKKFIEWAVKKGLNPPVQLLEFMGMAKDEKPSIHIAAQVAHGSEKPLLTKEKETLLKMIIGMAVGGYGYDSAASKSSIPTDIYNDLALHGIQLDQDTIRNKLKDAAQFLSGAVDDSKPKSVIGKPKSAKRS